MVTSGHFDTTEKKSKNYEKDEHCPYGSLVDFDEMKSTAFGVSDEVLGPLMILPECFCWSRTDSSPELVAVNPRWDQLGMARTGWRPFNTTWESRKS